MCIVKLLCSLNVDSKKYTQSIFISQEAKYLVMSTKVAEGRLEVRQIYRLLQLVNEDNKPEVERILLLGVENLIHLTEPKDWIGVLHAATLTNNLGDSHVLLPGRL